MSTAIVNLHVPGLGESVTEATIAKWVKADGDQVNANDVLVELETDKAAVELPAAVSGVLKITKTKGTTVKVGDIIATIDPSANGKATTPTASPASAVAVNQTPNKDGKDIAPAPVCDLKTLNLNNDLSPAVRALVLENKLENAQIPATGKDGRLTKEDILNFLATRQPAVHATDSQAAQNTQRDRVGASQVPMATSGTTTVIASNQPAKSTAPAASQGEETRIEISKLRQTIAKRLVEAQHTTASLTTINEVDMSAIMALREKYKDKFEKSYGIGLGFMSFFAKAVIYALKAVPNVNAMIDANHFVQRKYVHLGIAVSTEKGLMVPVLRNAHTLSMAQIEAEIKRLAVKARDGKITVDDMAGGTFTITNGGVFGSLLSTPILNPPQSGILGMHKIEKRAVVITESGHDTIAIRPMMYVALTYDHRIIDGQQSVTFLVKVKEALEDPARMLMEI